VGRELVPIQMSRVLRVVSWLLPIAIVAAIWFPLFEHYYVPRVRIPQSSLAGFVSQPSDATMAVLGEQFLGVKEAKPTGLAADSPEEGLRRDGLFELAADLNRFEQTADAEQFEAIAKSVLEFSMRANRRFAYGEFLWNDHAIANRVFVLARFWGHYRKDRSFEPNDAREILEHVARNVQFLLRDDHFTAWTNHGVMQSLALLHAANAFPALPDRDRLVSVALDRLDRQLRFFVADSGWVMEHSAGYQEFGSNLLSTLLVELELLGMEPSPEWRSKTRESQRVLEWLTRPGGSIPNFGDSDAALADSKRAPATCEPISPGAGYWPEGYLVAWDVGSNDDATRCAQTTVVWSGFISNAHRRPNELSVHYWVDGVDYVMGSGYWPYGDPDRLEAIGWRGSNAPHVSGESGTDTHTVQQNGLCLGSDFRFIDLERRNVSQRDTLRRQVVDMGRKGVLLIDSGEGQPESVRESVWRIDERLTLVGPNGRPVQTASVLGGVAHVIQVSGTSATVEPLSRVYAREGHTSPEKFSAVAARESLPTYVVMSAAGEPTLIALTPRDARNDGSYRLSLFESPERWRVEDRASLVVVERSGPNVKLTRVEGPSSECNAAPDAIGSDGIRDMESSFLELTERYPVFKEWTFYRFRATLIVFTLFVAQFVVMALLASVVGQKLRGYADVAVIAGWLGLGGYITLIYLAQ
jgi:hypothetical protein